MPAHAVPLEGNWQQDPSRRDGLPNPRSLLRPELVAPHFGKGTSASEQAQLAAALEHIRHDRRAEARKIVDDVLRKAPNSAPAHELQGVLLAFDEKYDAALKAFSRAIGLDPKQSSALVKIGDIYLAQGKVNEAKLQYQAAIKANDVSRLPHQRLGLIAEQSGDCKSAVPLLERGLEGTPPGYVGVKVNLARCYNTLGQFAKTAALLDADLAQKARSAAVHQQRGVALALSGDPKNGLASLKTARDIAPKDAQVRIALGVAYRVTGDPAQSIAELQRAVELDPKSSTAHFQLGESQAAAGRAKEAFKSLERAEGLSKNPAAIRLRRAELETSARELDKAIATYRSLYQQGERSAQLYEGLTLAYQLKLDFKQAEALAKERVAAYPKDADAYLRHGMVMAAQASYPEAVSIFKRGLEVAPAHVGLTRALSLAYFRQGDATNAIKLAEDIAKRDPGDARHKVYLATLYDHDGKDERAAKLYEDILKQEPKFVLALNNLAMIESQRKRHDRAVALAQQAAELAAADPQILDTYGWVLHRAGRSKQGLETLEKAAKLDPNAGVIRYHLGSVQLALGQREAAKKNLDAALSSGGDASWLAEARKAQQQAQGK